MNNYFFDIVYANAKEKNKKEAEDYIGAEGLLYCGKCHTPKECRLDDEYILKLGYGALPTPCKCSAESFEKERRAQKSMELECKYDAFKDCAKSPFELLSWFSRNDYTISKRLISKRRELQREICFTDNLWADMTFDLDDAETPKLSSIMRNFVTNFDRIAASGKGLLLLGEVGTGKTFYAACVANALIDNGKTVFMAKLNYIRNKLQENFEGKQSFLDAITGVDLLIIDDFGAEADTGYMQEIAFEVIDERTKTGLPMIITTNLSFDQMLCADSLYKKRLYSRILGSTRTIKVNGDDRRLKNSAKSKKDVDTLLGI